MARAEPTPAVAAPAEPKAHFKTSDDTAMAMVGRLFLHKPMAKHRDADSDGTIPERGHTEGSKKVLNIIRYRTSQPNLFCFLFN